MRKVLLLLVVVAGVVTVGCQGLFTPNLCTETVTITDTVTINGQPTRVDTLGRFKLCAQ